ncbi:antimicrobial peptide NK-lysin-like [Thunnus maccoyii]|uniref:antimicrobial peptide NK-lysin-like n=1 Tax=Thunnus maccoyii TaxID=8240 RepID=UPI001C4D9D42|nr:antimicrobial peptide NK-lysin-like [Thunnus maccoyii]
MTPAVSIALLLLSATVVKSWGSLEDQTEVEGDFSSQFKQHVREGADHHAEKEGDRYEWMQEGSSDPKCLACKKIVSDVQKKLGGNNSKEEVKKQVDGSCNEPGILRQACKDIIRKPKDELIDGIAKGETPEKICKDVSYCQ